MNHCRDSTPRTITMAQDNKHAPAPTTPQRATDRRVCTPQPPTARTENRGAVVRSGTTPADPHLHARARAAHTTLNRALEAHVRSLAAARPTPSHATTTAVPTSVDAALDVFGARVQADMRDFRALCGALVRAEQQEKEQWRELCRRVIAERDAARAALGGTTRKRVHDSADVSAPANGPQAPGTEQPRAVRPLPASRAHSHSRSSSTGSGSDSQRASSQSTARSTPPPPPHQAHEPCTPARSRSAPPSSAAFNVRVAPGTTSAPRAAVAPEADAPPPKRRRSCDLSLSALRPPAQVQAHGAPRTAVLPGDFDHVDIMYAVAESGALVCRACMIEAAKGSPADPSARVEPRTFPKGASWDDLRAHCVRAHPAACVDVARLHPAEVFELRRRLSM
ncbi:hypothetical protein HYPSUDRAFT_444124 [Hypholoma sublateritium FD-334 SS-4]|uniref:Uncharacterized protein n=1 Tax=Hypholoma sublateritium (strain FD-334 SS-4) TaxID=945553 RepID=A0A0D2LUA3_HYPSF|nr:hypothetical protein HYPSUDRAFT_444124 [Hypholoma sublateritium FD-334 SS-4]